MATRVQVLLDAEKHEQLSEEKPPGKTWEDVLEAGVKALGGDQ